MAKLFEARKLSAFYGATQVLFDIDFAIDTGKITTILGANGAGTHNDLTMWHIGQALVNELDPIGYCTAGIPPNFVRFSVGLEHPDDLQRDLAQALTQAMEGVGHCKRCRSLSEAEVRQLRGSIDDWNCRDVRFERDMVSVAALDPVWLAFARAEGAALLAAIALLVWAEAGPGATRDLALAALKSAA